MCVNALSACHGIISLLSLEVLLQSCLADSRLSCTVRCGLHLNAVVMVLRFFGALDEKNYEMMVVVRTYSEKTNSL